ncbi:primosomal protein N' [Buchnera aphidicola]|uniref:replication restart helicase PriA n=1 Tax=Buchnera aphidicola TaxID=9 RepID=UPI003464DEAE
MFIIQVVLFLPIKKFFEYTCPKEIIPIVGSRVSVPFGTRKVIGMIVSFYYQIGTVQFRLRSIYSIIDKSPIYTQKLWKTLKLSSIYYHCSIGHILCHILPTFLKKGKVIFPIQLYKWTVTNKGKKIDISILKRTPKQHYALSVLRHHSVFQNEFKKYNLSNYVLKKLKDKFLCDVYISSHWFTNSKKKFLIKDFDIKLNKKEYLTIERILNKGRYFTSWLLTGMKSTIKRQIYFNLVLKILERGLQILILVSNDNVVDQVISLFQIYFNVPIDAFYSGTTNYQKFSIWFRAKNNETAVIIGTKKAIFIPIAKLGIIIIDEEHSVSYKNKKGWCYNARDIGILRAYQEKIPIVLESVSPTLETLKNVINKKCQHVNLHRVILDKKKIIQKIIDIKSEKLRGGLSITLINSINQHIYNNKTVLLIINNNNCIFFVLCCKHCNWIAKCNLCNEYYYFNEHYQDLCCKFCFVRFSVPLFCFNCGSGDLISRSFGIENMKVSVKRIFSNIPVLCINYISTKLKKNVNKNALQHMSQKGVIILIREKDIYSVRLFVNITLVAMVLIDSYFTSMTFRSIERFAQFYTHSINLLDNYSKYFEVLIQTTYPNDADLNQLIQEGYSNLSINLLKKRQFLKLPPFTYHVMIYVKIKKSCKIENLFLILQDIIKNNKKESNINIWMMGTCPDFYQSKNGKYYVHKLLLQSSSRNELHNVLQFSIDFISIIPMFRKIKWKLDIDPIDI